MIQILALLALLLLPEMALAQSTVLQGGPWVPGHVGVYGPGTSQPIIIDGGPAHGGGLGVGVSELGIIARGTGTPPYAGQGTGPYGTNVCDYDAPITNATGYHFLCFSANVQGGGLIAYGTGGIASQLPLRVNVNGVTQTFPFGGSGAFLPLAGGTMSGNIAMGGNAVTGAVFPLNTTAVTGGTNGDILGIGTGGNAGKLIDTGILAVTLSSGPVNVATFGATGGGDVTTELQAAINSCAASGCELDFPAGNYITSNTLTVGNGNGVTASTINNIKFKCLAAWNGLVGIGFPTQGPCNIQSSVTGPAIKVAGPISGWSFDGMSITFSTTSTSAVGLLVDSGFWGDVNNLLVAGSYGYGIQQIRQGFQNVWRHVHVWMPPAASAATGISISGLTSTTTDIFDDSWYNVEITPSNTGQTALYLGAIDSFKFYDLAILPVSGRATGIVFDYSVESTTGFPGGNLFYGVDTYGNTITNVGTAPAPTPATYNRFYSFAKGNGSSYPTAANILVADTSFASQVFLNSNGGSGGNNIQILLGAGDAGVYGRIDATNLAGNLSEPLYLNDNGGPVNIGGTTTMPGFVTTTVAPTVSANQIGYGSTVVAASNCGGGSITGCIVVNVAGMARYVPYY